VQIYEERIPRTNFADTGPKKTHVIGPLDGFVDEEKLKQTVLNEGEN